MSKDKSKVKMPKELKNKCHAAIHTATTAAAAAGAIPIPFSDTIPISTAQVGMIIALGKIFDLTINTAVAKSIIGVGLAHTIGLKIATSLKAIPGIGKLFGGIITSATAATLTESLGWLVADDFYRMSIGEEPENIADATRSMYDFKNSNFM